MALCEHKSCVEKYARRKYFGKVRNEIIYGDGGGGGEEKREGRKKC